MNGDIQQLEQFGLTENELSNWVGYLSFKPNFILKALLDCDSNCILIETGNQSGKTDSIAMYYVMRILGVCPNEKKNIRPDTPIRTLRFASEILPTDKEMGGEVRNTVYPIFKKRLPSQFIKKDITFRSPVMTIRDPQGGPDIKVEFVSYNQETQAQAGVQRLSINLDEQSPKEFYEEQWPRLIAADGDVIMGVTLTEGITWMFEDIYEKAGIIYNSPYIIDYLFKTTGIHHLPKEIANPKSNIVLIRAATDDNPTLDPKIIEEKLGGYDDQATMEVRRYGIPHQMSGVIFKEFDRCNIISRDKYFPDGMPHEYIHARGIDYHEHTNWAIPWMCLSPQDEAFIYEEYNPSPDRLVTREIAREIAHRSKDYKFKCNLVDPRMAIMQASVGYSSLDDINKAFSTFKKEGIGTGGYWETWDTKNLRGRDIVKERLKNARMLGRPFINRIVRNDGREEYLPTLWILDNCPQTIHSFKSWQWEQWATKDQLITKEEKNKAQDRFSHFPITVECIFKDTRFSIGRFRDSFEVGERHSYDGYFNTGVRV